MSEVHRFRLIDLILLLIVLAVAGSARGWYLSSYTNAGNNEGPLEVQGKWEELKTLVDNLKNERAFRCKAPLANEEEETAHVAPGYPALLAALELLPIDLSPMDRTVRWLQWGLGTLTAGFYFLFARRAFRSRAVGTLAGLLCAVHPFWIVNTAEINDGVLTSFLLAACIALGARGSQSGGALTSLLYGSVLATLALVRGATLPFAFVALLWFLLRCRSVSRGWLCALLAVLGFVNPLTLWTLRNHRVLGDLVPVVDSTPYHIWWGMNPRPAGQPQTEEALLNALAAAQGKDPKALGTELAGRKQVERYRSLSQPIREQLRKDPAPIVEQRFRAGLSFFFGERWTQGFEAWGGSWPEDWCNRTFSFSFLLGMLLLGVLGWRWTFGWRRESMPASLAVMWIPLPYILSHAEALHGPRLPLDGVFLTYAAFAIVCLIPFRGGDLLAGPETTEDSPERPDRLARATGWR